MQKENFEWEFMEKLRIDTSISSHVKSAVTLYAWQGNVTKALDILVLLLP